MCASSSRTAFIVWLHTVSFSSRDTYSSQSERLFLRLPLPSSSLASASCRAKAAASSASAMARARLCSISRVSFGDSTPGAHFTCRLRSAAGAEFGNERSGSGGSGRRGVPSCVVRRGCTRSAQGIWNTSSPSMASTASTRRDAAWPSCSPEEAAAVAAVAAAEQLC